jgi:hypothetical protein
MDKVFGIFSETYDDWSVHGFFEDKIEAEKYCALINKEQGDYDRYYVIEVAKIKEKVDHVKLYYYYKAMFDFDLEIKNEKFDIGYEYDLENNKFVNSRYKINHNRGWIDFSFYAISEEEAKNIAYEKFNMFKKYYNENKNYDLSASMIGSNRL